MCCCHQVQNNRFSDFKELIYSLCSIVNKIGIFKLLFGNWICILTFLWGRRWRLGQKFSGVLHGSCYICHGTQILVMFCCLIFRISARLFACSWIPIREYREFCIGSCFVSVFSKVELVFQLVLFSFSCFIFSFVYFYWLLVTAPLWTCSWLLCIKLLKRHSFVYWTEIK